MSFASLGLNPLVLHCLETTGYTEPTQVQRQAIPAAIEGHDLLVSSHTGSGKTAAFLLPSLHKLAEPSQLPGGDKIQGPRMLVLCPTRELALQVQKQAIIYGKGLRKLRTVCLVGGAPFGPQFQALKVNPEVMIATPGRLMDHMERGRLDFSRLEVLVLDEADRMLDMGFIEDIESIASRLPATRQTLLFSATLDGTVGKLARNMTRDARRIEVATVETHKANIDQRMLFADDMGHKNRLLDHLLRDVDLTQALVFTATKRSADDLSESLLEQGYAVAALHGDMPQHKRNRTLQRLRDGAIRVLVATDVAARGIDVAGISHVINFDAPRQAEDYVHRIGRTGRAGRSGVAVTLLGGRERGLLREIERFTGDKIRIEVIPGLEPRARPDHEPRRKSGSEWHGKPRGEWQNKPRSGQFPGLGRKPEGTGFGGGYGKGSDGGWKGQPEARPAREGNTWNRAEARPERGGATWAKSDAPRQGRQESPRGEANGNTWAKPEPRRAEVNGNTWDKPAVRPAWKEGNSETRRPALGKPKGRQSW